MARKNPSVAVTVEGDQLVIRLPLSRQGKLSKSEKTLVVASTNGNILSDVEVGGKKVTVGVNAYIPRD